jgi:hypothetical protein
VRRIEQEPSEDVLSFPFLFQQELPCSPEAGVNDKPNLPIAEKEYEIRPS